MSKANKDVQAPKAVLAYLNKQNRPFSANDIHNNLHREYGKTAIVKALENMAQDGTIKEKVNGKQKAYVADQSQFPDVDESEMKEMETKIAELTAQVKATEQSCRQTDSTLKSLTSSMTTSQATDMLDDLTKQCSKTNAKLEKLREGQVLISKEEKDKVYNDRDTAVREWRKRKRMCKDILDAILEGYPKSKKQLHEDIGIETDEDYNTAPPEV